MTRFVNKNRAEFLILFILFLILLPAGKSQGSSQGVGVGINSYSITFNGTIFDSYTVSPRIINPSDYDIKVNTYFDCFNCVQDVKIFGFKIGEKIDDYNSYFKFDETDLFVPAKASGNEGTPVIIHFAPKFFLKKYFSMPTPRFLRFFIRLFDKDHSNIIKIPYFVPFIGEKHLKGLLAVDVYWSTFGEMGVTPSVGASLQMTAHGMPVSSFIFLVLLIILLILFILRKKGIELKDIPKKLKFRK
jgi:hypothetical protein